MPWPVHPVGFFGSGDQDTYKVERSLRFNSADSAYLNRTFGTPTNNIKWTWSGWVKRSTLGSYQNLFCGDDGTANNFLNFRISDNNDRIDCFQISGGSYNLQLVTDARFRDPSAWYHVVLIYDSANATSTDRVQIYVNGTRQTVSYPVGPFAQNTACQANVSSRSHAIGRVLFASTNYLDGYLTEINFIDGQALTPSSFGETDSITGRWKVKRYAGTYGTNGFYLNFADNSGTTATTLGKDLSGNGNNWTPNNFSVTAGAGNDSLLDSPTDSGTSGNYATLNPLYPKGASTTFSDGNLRYTNTAVTADQTTVDGWTSIVKQYYEATCTTSAGTSQFIYAGDSSGGYYCSNGQIYVNNTLATTVSTYTSGDILGFAVDVGSVEKIYKNGSLVYTSSGTSSGRPIVNGLSSTVWNLNFGQRPFAYTAPTGYKALCTTNLPTPTIKKPSRYMDVVTYTGNGSTQTISSLGFSPDLVWLKRRNLADSHGLFDSVRGAGWRLQSNDTNAEVLRTDVFTSFDTNGFSITGSDTQSNASGSTYVAWTWDEAPIAGMDIVSYTGNGTNRTIAHNLGVAPKMMIVKNRLYAGGWRVYHQSIGNTKNLRLNLTNAEAVDSTIWNNTSPTSSDFAIGTDADVNRNNDTHIAYLFSEVEGFSKFGSYTGNGSADGPFVWCGFRPRWVMVKRTDTAGFNWVIWDTARSTSNQVGDYVLANAANAENNVLGIDIDALSNGFKLRDYDAANSGNTNISMATYIFAAFAESPFKYARAR